MALTRPSSDFVSTTLNGALAAAATTATIGTGLSIPATNSYLQIDYDSTTAVGSDNGPETIFYAAYTSGTGALTGITRGHAGTTDVAHANGAKVQLGMSTEFLEGFVGARAYLAATIADTISAGHTKIVLDTETYDVGANFATGKFTAPVNGFYRIIGKVTFAACTTAKTYNSEIYVDGAAVEIGYGGYVTTDVASISSYAVTEVYMAKDSYVELYYYHTGATTVDVVGGATHTNLTVSLIKEVTAITG